MARRFFYVCGGILMLAAAYSLGARDVRAEFDPTGFPIAGLAANGAQPLVLRSDGTVWHYGANEWIRVDSGGGDLAPIPFPLTDIAFFDWPNFVTRDGEVYRPGGTTDSSFWQSIGSPPPPPVVSTKDKTWSGAKEAYRK